MQRCRIWPHGSAWPLGSPLCLPLPLGFVKPASLEGQGSSGGARGVPAGEREPLATPSGSSRPEAEMNRVVSHVWSAIVRQNAEHWKLVLDESRPVRSVADMRPWYTSRPCEVAKRSHVNVWV